MAKIGMIGAGSWGTALALLCDKNGHEVTIWSIMKDEVRRRSRSPIISRRP